MATPVTVELVWREDTGWNVLTYGADGSSGHRIPIMTYIRWLHQLYELPPNLIFGEPLLDRAKALATQLKKTRRVVKKKRVVAKKTRRKRKRRT